MRQAVRRSPGVPDHEGPDPRGSTRQGAVGVDEGAKAVARGELGPSGQPVELSAGEMPGMGRQATPGVLVLGTQRLQPVRRCSGEPCGRARHPRRPPRATDSATARPHSVGVMHERAATRSATD